jgi:hypothetical protein
MEESMKKKESLLSFLAIAAATSAYTNAYEGLSEIKATGSPTSKKTRLTKKQQKTRNKGKAGRKQNKKNRK